MALCENTVDTLVSTLTRRRRHQRDRLVILRGRNKNISLKTQHRTSGKLTVCMLKHIHCIYNDGLMLGQRRRR